MNVPPPRAGLDSFHGLAMFLRVQFSMAADMIVNCEKAYGPFRRRPSHRPRSILRRAGAVGLGCMLGLSAVVDANAYNHGHSADRPSLAAAEASSDGMTGMSMKRMGAMIRPDMSPPLGVTGGMSPKQGVFMPSVQYMHMRMDGNRDGTDDVSTVEVLAEFPIAPLSMDVDMLMAGAMYGITDDISVMAMIPYVWKTGMIASTESPVPWRTPEETRKFSPSPKLTKFPARRFGSAVGACSGLSRGSAPSMFSTASPVRRTDELSQSTHRRAPQTEAV